MPLWWWNEGLPSCWTTWYLTFRMVLVRVKWINRVWWLNVIWLAFFFVNIFFVFPCKIIGKILPMITITSMILFLFCYCIYINVESMYTQDVFKSKCWCWLDPFLHQLIWQTSNQKQLLRVFERHQPPAGRFGANWEGSHIPSLRSQHFWVDDFATVPFGGIYSLE